MGDTNRRIAALIGEMAARLTEFVAVLEEEQAALVDGALDKLLPLAARKTDCAAQLAALDERRLDLLHAWQPEGRPDITHWLASAGHDSVQLWREVTTLAAKASELNAINGKLINERMRHNQQALNILLEAGERSSLYGPDGQPRLGGSGRPLGSA